MNTATPLTTPLLLTTLDAAQGMQRKHSKLLRDIDRVRSLLPPEFAAQVFPALAYTDAHGRIHRAYRLTIAALPFLCMGQARKCEILWMMQTVDNTVLDLNVYSVYKKL